MKNHYFNRTLAIIASFAMLSLAISCGSDDGAATNELVASFQFEVSADNFAEVSFSNFSQNATSYAWDFGDGSGTSTDENPTYVYSAGGTYSVTLTASNDDGDEAVFSSNVTITDPDEALTLLAGTESKTWKLLREGTAMLLAADPQYSQIYWEGSSNNGQRPCLYDDEFTFGRDGSYTFNDAGTFWAEFAVFNSVDGCDNDTPESCFEAIAANMINACNEDVSAWLSGTHSYEYTPSTGKITLTGEGAWIGIPKLGTDADTYQVPQSSVTFDAVVVDGGESGVDSLFVSFTYEGGFWPITYVSYSDPSLEPDLVTDFVPPTCDPLTAISPTEISHTFASNEATEWELLQPTTSGSTLTLGVDDPDEGPTAVGQYTRVAGVQYQELQFKLEPANAINFENLTTMTMEVYIPSTNDYSGDLTDNVFIGFGATNCPPDWYTDQHEYQEMAIAKDQWVTITFDLATDVDYVAIPDNGATVYDRNDLDMIYIAIGGAGHVVGGDFYIRNFSIQ